MTIQSRKYRNRLFDMQTLRKGRLPRVKLLARAALVSVYLLLDFSSTNLFNKNSTRIILLFLRKILPPLSKKASCMIYARIVSPFSTRYSLAFHQRLTT